VNPPGVVGVRWTGGAREGSERANERGREGYKGTSAASAQEGKRKGRNSQRNASTAAAALERGRGTEEEGKVWNLPDALRGTCCVEGMRATALASRKGGKQNRTKNIYTGIASLFSSGSKTRGRRSSPFGKEGRAFPSIIVVGTVRISTLLFVLSLLEAILWTCCSISSSAALATDTLAAEHYLLRETENLKSNASRILQSSTPVFEPSYELKQHVQIEQFWAERTLGDWSIEHSDWLRRREHFSLAFSVLDKGIPGPFASISAIH